MSPNNDNESLSMVKVEQQHEESKNVPILVKDASPFSIMAHTEQVISESKTPLEASKKMGVLVTGAQLQIEIDNAIDARRKATILLYARIIASFLLIIAGSGNLFLFPTSNVGLILICLGTVGVIPNVEKVLPSIARMVVRFAKTLEEDPISNDSRENKTKNMYASGTDEI